MALTPGAPNSYGSGFAPITPSVEQSLLSALMGHNQAGRGTPPAQVVGAPGGPQQSSSQSPVAMNFMASVLQGLFHSLGQPSQGQVQGAASDYTNPANYGMVSGTGTLPANGGPQQPVQQLGSDTGGWLAGLLQNYLGIGGNAS